MKLFDSYSLGLSGAQLSDLFFNYEHFALEELYKRYANQKVSPSPEELHAATLADARDFVDMYTLPVTAEELAADFEARV